jgi:ABC-type multidrug transport system fused ATPase/permease subunit
MTDGTASALHPKYSLIHYVWKLLRLQVEITFSTFRAGRLRRKIGMILLYVGILIFAVFVFVVSWLLLWLLRSPDLAKFLAEQGQPSIAPFLESVPVLILAGSFLALMLSSFGVLLQALYLAGDMDFLLSAPVPVRAVFVSKQLQAILPNFGLVALFGLPVLLGLGASGGYNFLYYPMVVIVLALTALAAAGVSSFLVMGVVRVFPARRVAEVLGAVGAIVSILCSQSGNFINAMHPDYSKITGQQIPLDLITRFNSPWIPLSWPGRGLVDLGQGRWLSGILFLALTLVVMGGLFYLSLITAERLYYTGWARMQVGSRKKRTAAKPSVSPALAAAAPVRTAHISPLARFIPSPVLGIVGKDFLTLRRDPRSMSQLVTPLIVALVYGVFLLRPGAFPSSDTAGAPDWLLQGMQNVMVYGSVGLAMFVGWSLQSRLALMGFSQEGKNYWVLKCAPISTLRLVASKFLVAYVPALVLGWACMVVVSLLKSAPISILVFGLIVVALSVSGTAGINLAYGILGVNLTWEDPRRMNAGFSGCLSPLFSLIYLAVVAGLFIGPAMLLGAFGVPALAGQAVGLVLGGTFSVACAIIPLWLASRRVARIGES